MDRILRWLKQLFSAEEELKLEGHWRLTAYYKGTKRIFKVLEGKNTIVTVGKQLVGDMLIDETGYNTGLTYCALGSDATAPAIGQTQLVNEGGGAAMRKEITSRTRNGNVITLSTFFTAAQSNIAIEEAAIFGHSTASAAENSGVMYARWLSSFDNSDTPPLYDLTFDYVLTIG